VYPFMGATVILNSAAKVGTGEQFLDLLVLAMYLVS